MAESCKPCSESVFKRLSSNPDFSDILAFLQENGGDSVNVIGDDEFIFVTKSVVNDVDTYQVRYEPYTPLSINSFSTDKGLQVKGVTVTSFTLNWGFNKSVETQSLNQGLTAPTPVQGTTSYSLNATGQSVTSDTTYTIAADDNIEDANASKTRNTSILFGNYIYQTQITIADRDSITTSTINALDLPNLPKTLTRSRGLTFTAQSIATSYDVILMPASFGLTSGTQFKDLATNFTGGWGKLFDMDLTNEAGFTESYGVWVASNKNLNGLTFQIS